MATRRIHSPLFVSKEQDKWSIKSYGWRRHGRCSWEGKRDQGRPELVLWYGGRPVRVCDDARDLAGLTGEDAKLVCLKCLEVIYPGVSRAAEIALSEDTACFWREEGVWLGEPGQLTAEAAAFLEASFADDERTPA